MSPKGSKVKTPTKKELEEKKKEEDKAFEDAKAKKIDQINFGASMTQIVKPTEHQQQTLDLYRSLPHRSDLKAQIIAQWKQDTVDNCIRSFELLYYVVFVCCHNSSHRTRAAAG